ncbi:MAG: hypothetical protein HONBIEJF_00689 [Fimbriimonadaceae bacterium]|nr:hypothetical protein [Fimbriimonadaceae bacterium]
MGIYLAGVLAFLGSHQPMVIQLVPPVACNHSAQEFGNGLKRLDPGTVNLPIRIGDCEACQLQNELSRRSRLVTWLKKRRVAPTVEQ